MRLTFLKSSFFFLLTCQERSRQTASLQLTERRRMSKKCLRDLRLEITTEKKKLFSGAKIGSEKTKSCQQSEIKVKPWRIRYACRPRFEAALKTNEEQKRVKWSKKAARIKILSLFSKDSFTRERAKKVCAKMSGANSKSLLCGFNGSESSDDEDEGEMKMANVFISEPPTNTRKLPTVYLSMNQLRELPGGSLQRHPPVRTNATPFTQSPFIGSTTDVLHFPRGNSSSSTFPPLFMGELAARSTNFNFCGDGWKKGVDVGWLRSKPRLAAPDIP